MKYKDVLNIGKGIIIVLIIILLLFAGIKMYADDFKGDPGLDGYTPQKNIDYYDGDPGPRGPPGPQGEPGYTPIIGIDYFNGSNGRDGHDGADAPINRIPIIKLINNSAVQLRDGECCYRVRYSIIINVSDEDNDNIHTWINIVKNGTYELIREYITQGNFNATYTITYRKPVSNQSIVWMVETWDGSDLANKYYITRFITEV